MFFGVPNRGLETSSLTSLVKGQPNEDLVRNLDPSSRFLSLLHEMFYSHFTFEDSKIICIFETKMTPTVEVRSRSCICSIFYKSYPLNFDMQWSPKTGSWERTGRKVMMVPQTSATHAGKNEKIYDQLSIDADHSDMVKFSDPSNPDYVIIASRIKQLVADAPRVIHERIVGHRKSERLC
jgi:hypothetical protein